MFLPQSWKIYLSSLAPVSKTIILSATRYAIVFVGVIILTDESVAFDIFAYNLFEGILQTTSKSITEACVTEIM